MDSLKELVEYLNFDARLDLQAVAVQNILGKNFNHYYHYDYYYYYYTTTD